MVDVIKVEARNRKNNLRENSNERHRYTNIIMISKKIRNTKYEGQRKGAEKN